MRCNKIRSWSLALISAALITGCSFAPERIQNPDEETENGESPQPTQEEFREFSEIDLPDSEDQVRVYDAEEFSNGTITYWAEIDITAKAAETMCETIGNFFQQPIEEMQDWDSKGLKIPQETFDAHEGDVRQCGARIDQHQGRAMIFYPPGVELGSDEMVLVYYSESASGW